MFVSRVTLFMMSFVRSISHFGTAVMLVLCLNASCAEGQNLKTNNPLINSAFRLAVWTVDHNTHNGLIHAGGGYGGEWTRDCAINCWNAVSLLRPQVAEQSLWSVTEDSLRIGHQYWDKILWVIAAHNHYLVTLDTHFLRQAYRCSALTMSELETQCFDTAYGLFTGPAVFQDGIAGYDEPIYDPALWDDSYVLHHPNSSTIKCLSTNAVYLEAYRRLALMSQTLGENPSIAKAYLRKASALRRNIRRHLYLPEEHKTYYLIDHLGHPHPYQEGMGLALSLLTDIFSPREVASLIANTYITAHGIPCVYPSFPRNTPDKPGRHNLMIWPHINMLYASGCAENGRWEPFFFELENLADLAINRGHGDFYEIYTIEGEPSGGWQCGALWDKKEHQTWCATGYLRLILNHIFGLTPTPDGLLISPHGLQDGAQATLTGIPYHQATLTLTLQGSGSRIKSCQLNGTSLRPTTRTSILIPPTAQGPLTLDIHLSN